MQLTGFPLSCFNIIPISLLKMIPLTVKRGTQCRSSQDPTWRKSMAPFHIGINYSTFTGRFNTENSRSFNTPGRLLLNDIKCCLNITSTWGSFTYQQETFSVLFCRLAKIAGDFLTFSCIQAAKLYSPLLRGREVQSFPVAARDSLTSFLFSSRFWTLTVGCFYIVRAKKSWKLFRG